MVPVVEGHNTIPLRCNKVSVSEMLFMSMRGWLGFAPWSNIFQLPKVEGRGINRHASAP